MNQLSKINFRQPKYMIPALILLPLLFIGYQVCGLFNFEEKKEKGAIQTEDVNTDLPEANLDKQGIKSKYQSMMDGFGKVTDYTGVEGVEKEEEAMMETDDLYTNKEKDRIDSINAANERQKEKLRNALLATNKEIRSNRSSQRNVNSGEELRDNEGTMDAFTKQMQMIQRISSGEKILTKEEMTKQQQEKQKAKLRQQIIDSIARTQAPKEVTKANRANERYFNTVENGEKKPNLIKGRVDEMVNAKSGSRLRIRLSDDIQIENMFIPKGTYLYANVTGFTAQRVNAKVTSILCKDKRVKVELSVYDIDGMEGFYVPQSSFRDFQKEAGAGAMNMNMNMNNSGEQSLQSVAMNSLQSIVQSTTSALSKSIKENKAKIKYNTEVYLINNNEK
jgi:conjugative transposon TraM protein